MTRRWNIPMTYPPKIPHVQDGTCTQTIRFLIPHKHKKCKGRGCLECQYTGMVKPTPKKSGDLIRFFTWTGRPYWSSWELLTGYMPITQALDIRIFPWGFRVVNDFHWNYWETDQIALWDGIEPPTGEALRDVLISKNGKIPAEGREAQIIRWEWKP